MTLDTIIVAGGGSRRMSGVDKCLLKLAKNDAGEVVALLQHVINQARGQVYVAGPHREVSGDVQWVADLVPDAGPAAGIWAAVQHVTADYVLLLAGDQILAEGVVDSLVAAIDGHDGAWTLRSQDEFRGHPLCSIVRTSALRDVLVETHGVNQSVYRLLSTLDLAGVTVNVDDVKDFDTWADVRKQVQVMGTDGVATQAWLTQLASEFGVVLDEARITELLNLTRDVAHGIERKAAPLTTFVIGYLAGQTGRDVSDISIRVNELINDWQSDGK